MNFCKGRSITCSSKEFSSEVFVSLNFCGQLAFPLVEFKNALVCRLARRASKSTNHGGDAAQHGAMSFQLVVMLYWDGDLEVHGNSEEDEQVMRCDD